ncbi:MAG: hypothetical protein ACK50P_22540 [Planctomycetaceae bacterium]|jgi:hypothetical protein
MFNGVINYYGTVVPGPPSTLHIHQYGAAWTTPGPFPRPSRATRWG